MVSQIWWAQKWQRHEEDRAIGKWINRRKEVLRIHDGHKGKNS